MRYLIFMIMLVFMIMFIFPVSGAKGAKTIKSLLESPTVNDVSEGKDKLIAKVNGVGISRREFLRVLYASAGGRVLRQFIELKLAEQLAADNGIALSKADFEKEMMKVVNALGPKVGANGKKLTYDDRLHLLNIVLRRRGISYEEFFMGIKTQAYLKAVAKKHVKITEDMLKREYRKVYGRKLNVRVIVVNNLKLAEKILQELQKGRKFSELALEYSVLPSGPVSGGLVKKVSRYDERLPALVLDCAFKLSVGQVSSPIKVDETYWIIKIEGDIPARDVSYKSVKSKLSDKLRKELVMEMARTLESDLLRRADIEIYNKELTREFSEWRKNMLKMNRENEKW